MSKEILDDETGRFLDTKEPQVLCIKGKWGVGKTFAWKQIVSQRSVDDANMQPYAYVSLFGINSLTALKFSIFEQTVSSGAVGEPSSAKTLQRRLDKFKGFGRKISGYAGGMFSLISGTDASELISQSAFLMVRNQIVCIDDLERKGRDLDLRDVLGLASFLKEERNCKIVLLLNDEQLEGADHADFQRNLEKVVDTTVHFSPGAKESCAIAFEKPDPLQIELARAAIALGITNIRVLIKIERQARRAWQLVEPFGAEVQKQSLIGVVLAGWSVMEPDHAPSIEFLRNFNRIHMLMRDPREVRSADESKWSDVLQSLQFSHADEFDKVIFDSVQMGRFDAVAIHAQAEEVVKTLSNRNEKTNFDKAWDHYHENLYNEDDLLAEKIALAAISDVEAVSPVNINSTVNFLEKLGYKKHAGLVVDAFLDHFKNDARILDGTGIFMGDEINPSIRAAIDKIRAEYIDPRDPRDVLAAAADRSGWSQIDVRLLSQQTADYFEQLFLEMRAPEVYRLIDTALSMVSTGKEGDLLRRSLETALTNISKRSPMTEMKLKRYLAQLEL